MRRANTASWASTPAVRASMRANHPTNTTPERRLARALAQVGVAFRRSARVAVKDVAVSIDLVVPTAKLAIFVDGCFWHACPRHATWPKRNGDWWRKKLETNRRRDMRQR